MKKLALVLLIGLCVFGLPLEAQIFEGGFAGALSGAMLGSLVGGRSGAAWGAAIGGGVGMIEGANERDRQNEAQAAFRRQQQERAAWEREDQRRRQQEMAALAAKQECCAPKPGAITPTSTNVLACLPEADRRSICHGRTGAFFLNPRAATYASAVPATACPLPANCT